MDLSGIIFVVLAVAWAVFLIPKALKHHDEAARTRSIDDEVERSRQPVDRDDLSVHRQLEQCDARLGGEIADLVGLVMI